MIGRVRGLRSSVESNGGQQRCNGREVGLLHGKKRKSSVSKISQHHTYSTTCLNHYPSVQVR